MKRAKTSGAGKNAKNTQKSGTKSMKHVDLAVVLEKITNLVGNHAVDMVKTTINEVDKGHYLAMKYLFEMIGLCPGTPAEQMPQEDSLAKTLLRRLQLPEEASPCAESINGDTAVQAQTIMQAGDAVE